MFYLHEKRIAEGKERKGILSLLDFFLTKEELKELQEELAQAPTTAQAFLRCSVSRSSWHCCWSHPSVGDNIVTWH